MYLMTAKGIKIPFLNKGIAFTRDLYIFIPMENRTKRDLLDIFDDPEQTSELTFYKDENVINEDTVEVIRGYTHNISISENDIEGTYAIGLRRPFDQ